MKLLKLAHEYIYLIKRLYWALRCWMGKPLCYPDFQNGDSWWFAKCRYCYRQAEVHDGIGGPEPIPMDSDAYFAWLNNS